MICYQSRIVESTLHSDTAHVMILLDVSKESLRTERDRLDQVIWNLDAKYDYDLLFAPIVKSNSEFNQWIDVIPFYKSVRREGVRYA